MANEIALRFGLCYFALFIVCLPFPYQIFPNIGEYFFPNINSDSKGMYLLTLALLIFSFTVSIIWFLLSKKREEKYEKLRYWFHAILSYYLSLQLFKYGFDKVFKYQFYLPEPNILFTPVGQLSADTLYWSSMGTSYSYNVFMGCMEILPAVLLLFRKTRVLGAIVAMLVLINVVAVNFSFDISVKIFSCFLLSAACIIAYRGIKKILSLLLRNEVSTTTEWQPHFPSMFYALTKSAIISLILLEVLFAYFQSGNFNDDQSERPPLHGAYNIKKNASLKRYFIHRNGYFITQNNKDEMNDYKMLCDTLNHTIILQNPVITLHYVQTKDTLRIEGVLNGQALKIEGEKINLDSLPLMRKEFHWMVD